MATAGISQNSGTKAATTAVSNPAAQAARPAPRRGAGETRPARTASGGGRTSRTPGPSPAPPPAPSPPRRRTDPDRQQRVRERPDDPGRHVRGHPAGGEEGGGTGERYAPQQDHVHRQPWLAAQHGGQDGEHRDVGRGARGGPDGDRVESLD